MRSALRGSAVTAALVAALAFAANAPASSSVAYQANPQHTGAVDDTLAPPLGVRWAVNLGAPGSYPIVADGRVFVTTPSTQGYGSLLSAFSSANGALLWQRSLTHTYFWSNLAYDGGRLFALDYDGVLQSFDPATGAAGWGEQLPGQYSFSSAPTAVDGVVYTGGAGSGGTVYAVRESDGKVLWTQSVENGDDSSPSVAGGHVFVSYACNQAYSFTAATGALDWHHSTGCEGGGGKTTVLYDGKLYIRDDPDLILDAASGSELGSYGSQTAPAFSNGVGLFLGSGALSAERTTGRIPMWSFPGDGGLSSAPFVVGSTVYEGTSNGNLYALDRDSGALLWSDCIGAPVPRPDEQNVSQPLTGFGAGDGLLVVPAGNYLVAYESRAGAAAHVCDGTQTTPATQFAGAGPTPAGSQTSAPPSGGVAGSQAASVALAASKRSIRYGQVVTLVGTATPGARVDLQSDPFPADRFTVRKSTTARSDGSFTFRVRPDRNTTFKAVAAGVESAPVLVYADVANSMTHRRLPDGRTRIKVSVLGPRDLPYARHRVWFYAVHGKTLTRIGSDRLRGKRGSFRASLTRRSSARHFAVCTHERRPDAWGPAYPIDRSCGGRRLRLP